MPFELVSELVWNVALGVWHVCRLEMRKQKINYTITTVC
jgi:hypothetical protein